MMVLVRVASQVSLTRLPGAMSQTLLNPTLLPSQVLDKLLAHPVIRAAQVVATPGADARGVVCRAAVQEHEAAHLVNLTEQAAASGAGGGGPGQDGTAYQGVQEDAGRTVMAFEIHPSQARAGAPEWAPATGQCPTICCSSLAGLGTSVDVPSSSNRCWLPRHGAGLPCVQLSQLPVLCCACASLQCF